MRKEDLLYFAQEHNIELPSRMKKKDNIVKFVMKELRQRRIKQWKEEELQKCVCCGKKTPDMFIL